MERGYIPTERGIWWSKTTDQSLIPNWENLLFDKRLRSIFLTSFWEAHRCLSCKIVLFSYMKEGE